MADVQAQILQQMLGGKQQAPRKMPSVGTPEDDAVNAELMQAIQAGDMDTVNAIIGGASGMTGDQMGGVVNQVRQQQQSPQAAILAQMGSDADNSVPAEQYYQEAVAQLGHEPKTDGDFVGIYEMVVDAMDPSVFFQQPPSAVAPAIGMSNASISPEADAAYSQLDPEAQMAVWDEFVINGAGMMSFEDALAHVVAGESNPANKNVPTSNRASDDDDDD